MNLMKKIGFISLLLLAQSSFASNSTSSHPVYFNGGDVKSHQSVNFDLPYQQMSPGVLYDISCVITGADITSYQPILNVKIIGDQVPQYIYPTPTSVINDMVLTYPFQDRLIAKSNTLIIHNFECAQCDTVTPIRMSVYNFDDLESVTFSNCYIIVGKQNAKK
jgi:hypothetical protein